MDYSKIYQKNKHPRMPTFLLSIQILNQGESVNTCTLACKRSIPSKNKVGKCKTNAPNINRLKHISWAGQVGFKSNQSGQTILVLKLLT